MSSHRGVVALLLAAGVVACGGSFDPPRRGFEQNVGQFAAGALFGHEPMRFFRDRVQLFANDFGEMSLECVNGNPALPPVGVTPGAFPLRLYFGTDPGKWRENVPHFLTVRYPQVYPGIDVEWNNAAGVPMLRIVAAPGADLQRLRMRFLGRGSAAPAFVRPDTVSSTLGVSIEGISAYQLIGNTRTNVQASFSSAGSDAFSMTVGAYDATRPLILEAGRPVGYTLGVSAGKYLADGSLLMSGYAALGDYPKEHGFLAAVSAKGEPTFLTLFDAVTPYWIAASGNGEITAAGNYSAETGMPPVTADAPRRDSRAGQFQGDGWVGRFDSVGRLRIATYADELGAVAVEAGGSVYLADSLAVNKWNPGTSSYAFRAPVKNVRSLAVGRGGIHFAASRAEAQPVTSGAYQARYESSGDVYVGTLHPQSGAVQMATYVPVIGRPATEVYGRTSIAPAPDGSLWLASTIRFLNSDAYTLVALNAGGTRVIYSAAQADEPFVTFDGSGNVLVAVASQNPGLPTALDAPLRAGCSGPWRRNLYLQTLSATGAFRSATYLAEFGWLLAFDGPTPRLLVTPSGYWQDAQLAELKPPASPAIHCIIHPASRIPLTSVAPGILLTIVGTQLGPVAPVNATIDAKGNLPLQLGGAEVRLNGAAMPLVSVQQGLITFHVPDAAPLGEASVEVWVGGTKASTSSLRLGGSGAGFSLFTLDGSGRGAAAALNEDGTVNAPDNPAKLGSVVSVFGTGSYSASSPLTMGNRVITPLYSGPAPGLVPGVRQVNVRIPADLNSFYYQSGWVILGPNALFDQTPPHTAISVRP